jgi:hypothetical protein
MNNRNGTSKSFGRGLFDSCLYSSPDQAALNRTVIRKRFLEAYKPKAPRAAALSVGPALDAVVDGLGRGGAKGFAPEGFELEDIADFLIEAAQVAEVL